MFLRHIRNTLAAFMFCAFASASANAGTLVGTKITNIRVDDTGLAIIFFNTSITSRPTCGNPIPTGMAINTNTQQGRSFLSTATAAFLAARNVDVIGKGSCSIYTANVEDLQNLTIN